MFSIFQVVWPNELNPNFRTIYIRYHPNTEFVLGDNCLFVLTPRAARLLVGNYSDIWRKSVET